MLGILPLKWLIVTAVLAGSLVVAHSAINMIDKNRRVVEFSPKATKDEPQPRVDIGEGWKEAGYYFAEIQDMMRNKDKSGKSQNQLIKDQKLNLMLRLIHFKIPYWDLTDFIAYYDESRSKELLKNTISARAGIKYAAEFKRGYASYKPNK